MNEDRRLLGPLSASILKELAVVRPRNGIEMMQAFAEGKTCVIPRSMIEEALVFLEHQLGDWSVKVGEFAGNRLVMLIPIDDTPLKFKRHLKGRTLRSAARNQTKG